MSTRSKISISMTVYNGERFIRDQLESFLIQTRLPDELVVFDDVSSDQSVALVREFARRAPFPVRICVNERNLGITLNTERAINACSGSLIVISDFDDVWYHDKLETIEERMEQHPEVGFIVSDADLVDSQLDRLGRRLFEAKHLPTAALSHETVIDARSFGRVPINGMSLAFRAELFPLVAPLPNDDAFRRWGIYDYLIINVLLLSGLTKGLLVSKTLGVYRQHTSQMVGAVDRPASERLKLGWRNRNKESSVPMLIELIKRLSTAPIPSDPESASLRRQALAHCKARCSMPSGRVVRLPKILRELLSLRYHRFSSGTKSAVKDLLFAN